MFTYQPTEHDELLLKTYDDHAKINAMGAVPYPHLAGLQAIAKLAAAQARVEVHNPANIERKLDRVTVEDLFIDPTDFSFHARY